MDESERVESSSEGEWEASSASLGGRPLSRTSPQQFLIMMAFMEEHGDLTKMSWSSLECVEKWERLRRELDAVGDRNGPPRPVSKWKKVWADLKNNTKRKALQKTRAGAGPLRLSHLEFRLLKLMGLIKTKSSAPAREPVAPAPVPVLNKQPPHEAAEEAAGAAANTELIELNVGAFARKVRPVPLLELQVAAGAGAGAACLDAPHRSMDNMEEGPDCAEFADCSVSPGPAPRPDSQGHTLAQGVMSSTCTPEQLASMFEFLAAHSALPRGLLRGSAGRLRARRLWEQLSQRLNCLPGCTKTVQQWQKVWADRKHLAKKNAAALRSSSACGERGDERGDQRGDQLLAWEQRVLAIIGEEVGGLDTSALEPVSPPANVKEEEADATRSQCEDPLEPRHGGPGAGDAAWGDQHSSSQRLPGRGWGRGWRRGGRALALLARALARGEARGEAQHRQQVRLRRAELRLQRGWQRVARRGLRLMERYLQREGGGGGAGGAAQWATVLVPRARPLVLHPDNEACAWPE